jgi:RNA polymerase sigma-70 factor (ECF subfamily)
MRFCVIAAPSKDLCASSDTPVSTLRTSSKMCLKDCVATKADSTHGAEVLPRISSGRRVRDDRVRSEISRRNRELVDNEVATTQSFEDEVASTLSGQCVRTALAGLDDDERVPIELAYMGGLSYCAVADFLELPEGTVKSRIRRGLRNLKASSDLVELMSD